MSEPQARKVLLVDMMSGANDYGYELVKSLAARVDLTVVTVVDSKIVDIAGIEVHRVFPAFGGGGSRFGKARQMLAAYILLLRTIWGHRSEVVHVQFFRLGAIDMLLYLVMLPILNTLIYTAHNVLPHERKWWHSTAYRFWYKRVSAIHVLSQEARDGVVALAGGELRIKLIPHGNYENFQRRTASASLTRAGLGLPENTPIVLQFGLVRDYKGVDLLVKAISVIPSSVPVACVIAGGGGDDILTDLRREIERMQLRDRICIIQRFLSDDDLASLLKISDLVVFPYRRIYQSGALLLAMTFGKAIIVSTLRAFQEYVENRVSAVVSNCEDAQTFAADIERVLVDPSFRSRLGTGARHVALTEFNWTKIAEDLSSLYRDERAQ